MRIWIIFKKELKDILRDRRTIMMMVVFPLLLVPALMFVVNKVQTVQSKKAEDKILKFHFVGKEFAPKLYQDFVSAEKNEYYFRSLRRFNSKLHTRRNAGYCA
mgnify:CR=1 FL=1